MAGSPLILSLSKGGRSQSFVSNFERGQRLSDLILVCRVIGMEPAELLGGWKDNGS